MGMRLKKIDAWVVLRFDDGAEYCEDRVAVKGVYDSEESASTSISNSSEKADVSSKYTVVRTRHFVKSDTPSSEIGSNRIQGFPTSHWLQVLHHDHPIPGIEPVKKLWDELPPRVRKRTLQPLLSYVTENAIARALGASVEDHPHAAWDLNLPGGDRVDVKTVILDITASKSPVVFVNPAGQIQFLALVVFRPDLSIEAAKMIPSEALTLFGRPGARSSTGGLVNVRVTPHLLHYSGAWDIPLKNQFTHDSE